MDNFLDLASICLFSIGVYIVGMLSYFIAYPNAWVSTTTIRQRLIMVTVLLILEAQSFATLLYDLNNTGQQFPLSIRFPVTLFQAAMVMYALPRVPWRKGLLKGN